MASKCFVLALVALFVVSGLAEAKSTPDVRLDILGPFLDLVDKIDKAVNKAIDDAVAKLPQLQADIKSAAKKIVDEINKKTQEAVDQGFALIDKLKDEAVQHGIDIDLCIGHQEDDIHAIANQIVDDTSACIQSNVDQADEIVGEAIKQIENHRQDVNDLRAEFQQCQSNSCRVKVMLKANKLLISIPLDIAKLALKAQKKVISIQVNFAVCLTTNSKKILTQLKPVVDNEVQCISNKLHGQPESRLTASKGIVDTVVALLAKLEKLVNDAVTKALDTLSALQKTLTGVANKTLDKLDETVQSVIDAAFAAIDKLKQTAENQGINVDLCIGHNEEDIKNIAKGISEDTKKCVQDNLVGVEAVVNVTTDSINDVLKEMHQQTVDMQNCNGNTICLLKVAAKAQGLVISLPLKVVNTVARTQIEILKHQAAIGVCLTKNAAKLTGQVKPVVDDVTKCIIDKLPGH